MKLLKRIEQMEAKFAEQDRVIARLIKVSNYLVGGLLFVMAALIIGAMAILIGGVL